MRLTIRYREGHATLPPRRQSRRGPTHWRGSFHSLFAVAFGVVVLAIPRFARAEGFSLLRSENGDVRKGNERLAAGDPKAALSAYERAARELPSEAGVHLDRGLALIRKGELPAAREALRLATRPPAPNAIRADAYYDLGNTFYKEADAKAQAKKHDEAQQLFREAADAFKQSLRLRPRDHNAGWNYELAARRIREQEDKQKQQSDQKQKDQKQKDQQQDQQKDQKQDQQQGKDDRDQKKKDEPSKPEQQEKKQSQDQQQQPDQQAKNQQEQKSEPQQAQKPRPEVERALDALQDGEQNLERLRAMSRAAHERKPEKDW